MLNDAVLARRKRNSISGKLSQNISSVKDFSLTFRSLSTINSLTIIVIEVIVFSVLCVLYLAFANKYITQGYIVNRLESERASLIVQNEVSNRLLEQAKSLSEIRDISHSKMVYYVPEFVEHTDAVALAE